MLLLFAPAPLAESEEELTLPTSPIELAALLVDGPETLETFPTFELTSPTLEEELTSLTLADPPEAALVTSLFTALLFCKSFRFTDIAADLDFAAEVATDVASEVGAGG
jgi:hypothetical protein